MRRNARPRHVARPRGATCSVSYARPAYVQPVVYSQPAYVARPVVATYPVYRPVAYTPTYVASYQPTYVARPVTCAVPAVQPVGPKVWVHDKVYVEGHPIRNFLTAITY